ncbi:hypothetical protein HXX76_003438 [Chlamydomonas incerta]|uniref:Uncharacterized protein n=1 Tax=Chlamydomonas incerta TaxID=51695 RepID=A0A835TPT8_CHLIN|nr:hypothetical protein HXX76_003438 [Chlamydomonas incerta]|eukprot:KAG2441830.1 hypothetical protein HXX76_003438 [Chlamydomonas incerta]
MPAELLSELLLEYRRTHPPAAKPQAWAAASGIKPRGLILPALALLLMSIPVLGICLPWYVGGGMQRSQTATQRGYVCQLYPLKDPSPFRAPGELDPFRVDPDDTPMLKAWEVWNKLRALSEARPSNATVAAADAARETVQRLQSQFFSELGKNCSMIASVLWGEASARDPAVYNHPVWQQWQLLVRRRTAWANSSAAQAVLNSAGPVIYSSQLTMSDVAALGADVNGTSDTTAAVAAVAAAAASNSGSSSSANANADELPYMPGIAAYALINSTLVIMDPITRVARLNMEQRLGTVNSAAVGLLTDEYGRLRLAGVNLKSDVISASGGTKTLTMATGDYVAATGVDLVLTTPTRGLYYFPFDEYTGTVKVFCVVILIGMWTLSSFACVYALDILFLRPRTAVLADAVMFCTLLFAMPGIRNVIPAVPPIGVGIDMFGFIWIMIMMMASGSMVLAKLVAQYVHTVPTAYDKLVRNELYKAWQRKQEADREAAELAAEGKVGSEPAGSATDAAAAAAAAKGAQAQRHQQHVMDDLGQTAAGIESVQAGADATVVTVDVSDGKGDVAVAIICGPSSSRLPATTVPLLQQDTGPRTARTDTQHAVGSEASVPAAVTARSSR